MDQEEAISEIRVRIVQPDPEQLAEYEASDRAALAERNARYDQELEPEPEQPERTDTDTRNQVSIDLETDR